MAELTCPGKVISTHADEGRFTGMVTVADSQRLRTVDDSRELVTMTPHCRVQGPRHPSFRVRSPIVAAHEVL